MPRLGPVLLRAERGGWRAVAALRLVPVIPHSLANYALGLTRLRIGPYALGSLLGQLPMTVAYADFGAAGSSALAGKAGWLAPTLIGLAALALSLALPRLTRQPRPDLSGFVDPTPPQQGATGVEREVVKTIVETAGRHRLLIFRRDDGRFGFSAEEQTLDLDGRSCWTPSWPSDSPICDSSETAEREARARVPWLSGPP
jgi:hypothetical protein